MFVLVLLKNVGLGLLVYALGTVGLALIYKLFMMFFGYTWSVRSACIYLDHHGRGNRQDANFTTISIDIFNRIVSVLFFAVIAAILGCMLLPNLATRIGYVLAVLSFFVLVGWIEAHYTIRIGRLSSIDEEGRVAYFESLDGIDDGDVFCLTYDFEDNREYLRENMKYIVVDFVHYKMFIEADEFEWGE